MTPQFKSMNELNDYLDKLEKRVNLLESENQQLRQVAPAQAKVDGNVIARFLLQTQTALDVLNPARIGRPHFTLVVS